MATDFSGLGRHPATVRGSPSCPDAVDSGALAVLGGSISPPPPDVSLCTDASLAGWGAHLLPTFETAHGIWSPEESLLHINLLELLAVFRALLCWYEKLRGRAVMLLTDNTTVVAYVNIRAGPAPDSCASWSSSSFSGAVRPALPSMSATSQDD